MARITHRLDQPDRFVAGTIGRPGERAFYLQARQGNRLISVLCEKEQVQILAEHLARLMDQISLVVDDIGDPGELDEASDVDPLDLPLDPDFRVGTMSIAWDVANRRIALELFASDTSDEEADDEEADGESLIVELPIIMGREFVARALSLVKAGRPPCPLCGQPLDASGHVCPRLNGYRAL